MSSLYISTSPEFQSVYTDLEYIKRNLLEANGAQSLSLPVFSRPEFRRVSIHTVRTDALDRLFEFVVNVEEISQNRAQESVLFIFNNSHLVFIAPQAKKIA